MKAALAYAPRPGPLGHARPWIAAVYLAPLAVAAFAFSNPIVLAAAGFAAIAAGYASGAGSSLRQPLRWSLGLAVMVIVVNAVASQRGATILLRGWDVPVLGQIDVSLEAVVEGAVVALRIVVALLVFAVWSACVDPDRVLRAIRPIASRSALTATMITRLVPLAAADGARLAEAGRLRGPAAAPLGRAALARRLVAGSLDRSVEIASTLELRGYGLGHRTERPRHRYEPGEAALLASGLTSAAIMIAAAGAGIASFDAYPRISLDHDLATLAFAASLPLSALLPLSGGILWRMAHAVRPRLAGVDGD
jgi:energy-coupling factor transport system permease protein